MAYLDTYLARAEHMVEESPFTIEVRFLGGLNEAQQAAFTAAADRWTRIIIGDLPSVQVDGEVIDDLLILAEGRDIDGPGQVLGQAGPTHLRPESAAGGALLPAKGLMSFDTADLAQMEEEGTLTDVITHEMGHVLGIGTVWSALGLLSGEDTDDPTFTGAGAVDEWRALGGDTPSVPVENTGGPGTRGGHWRESVFRNELMSGFISAPGNPVCRMTVNSLADLGYVVDLEAAEAYALPAPADRGAAVVRDTPLAGGRVLPVIPWVLPASSLVVEE